MAFKPVVFFSFVLLLAVNVSTGHDELLKEIGAEALPLAYAFCAIIMLYLVGIADDLIGVRYRAKFFIQIVCGIMLVAGGVELSDLHGMLFIHSMPSWISIPLTVFVTVFIINAINLIDGIDGLASGLCSIAFLFYGMTFIWFHQYLYAMLAFATLGVLIPFYYYKEIYIETERIIIRNFKQKDAEGLLEYLSHPRVNCFAGDRLCSREAAWAYMQYSPKDMLRYAVSLKKDDFNGVFGKFEIIKMLKKFGLNTDERKELYKQYADRLIASGNAYYAFDTPDSLDTLRKQFETEGKTFIYNHSNRETLNNSLALSKEETEAKITKVKPSKKWEQKPE
jgi:hypothetical protein